MPSSILPGHCGQDSRRAPSTDRHDGGRSARLSSGLSCSVATGTPQWTDANAATLQFTTWLRGHGLVADQAPALRIACHDTLVLVAAGTRALQASACALHVSLRLDRDALHAMAGDQGEAFLRAHARRAPAWVAPASSDSLRSACELVELHRRCDGNRLLYEAKCLELLAHLLATDPAPRPPALTPAQRAGIARVRERLLAEPATAPDPAELTRISGLSPFQLRQGFRTVYGQSIHALHHGERMRTAWRLIAAGEMDVCDAGHHVGYSNLSHFSAAFQRQFGLRPSELKRCAARAP